MQRTMTQKEILEATAATYKPEESERGYVHARLEQKRFDPQTGERRSIARIQKFGRKTFKLQLHDLRQLGYTVDVLFHPDEVVTPVKETPKEEKAATAEKKESEKKMPF